MFQVTDASFRQVIDRISTSIVLPWFPNDSSCWRGTTYGKVKVCCTVRKQFWLAVLHIHIEQFVARWLIMELNILQHCVTDMCLDGRPVLAEHSVVNLEKHWVTFHTVVWLTSSGLSEDWGPLGRWQLYVVMHRSELAEEWLKCVHLQHKNRRDVITRAKHSQKWYGDIYTEYKTEEMTVYRNYIFWLAMSHLQAIWTYCFGQTIIVH
jgi:hypothetical protein